MLRLPNIHGIVPQIDETNITRYVAVIGQDFRLSLDIDIILTPILNLKGNATLFHYIHDVSTDAASAVSIITILAEEPMKYLQDCHTTNTKECASKVDNVI